MIYIQKKNMKKVCTSKKSLSDLTNATGAFVNTQISNSENPQQKKLSLVHPENCPIDRKEEYGFFIDPEYSNYLRKVFGTDKMQVVRSSYGNKLFVINEENEGSHKTYNESTQLKILLKEFSSSAKPDIETGNPAQPSPSTTNTWFSLQSWKNWGLGWAQWGYEFLIPEIMSGRLLKNVVLISLEIFRLLFREAHKLLGTAGYEYEYNTPVSSTPYSSPRLSVHEDSNNASPVTI